MEKDYVGIWTRWIAFLQSDMKIRKEVLDGVHIEVKAGFEAVAKMSFEQLEHKLSNEDFFAKIKSDLEQTFLYGVWCGYMLFLISEELDPVEDNLVIKDQTNDLGDKWLENYEKDKCVNLLLQIDPLLSMILQNTAEGEFNLLIVKNSEKLDPSYVDASQIISYILWTMHQGFIFGMLEQSLVRDKRVVGV